MHSPGRCLRNVNMTATDLADATVLRRRYMFYAAFENSRVHDYVTEKLFSALAAGGGGSACQAMAGAWGETRQPCARSLFARHANSASQRKA